MPAFSVTVFDSAAIFFGSDENDAVESWKAEQCGCEDCPSGSCENFSIEVHREPLFDSFEGAQHIPVDAYERAGWGWLCQHCDDDFVSMPGDWRTVNGKGLCHECADLEKTSAA